MNRKLLRVLDEIDKTEAKIAEWQEHLARLQEQRKQLEEKEIVKAVRAMGLTSRQLVAAVDGLYAGKLTFAEVPDSSIPRAADSASEASDSMETENSFEAADSGQGGDSAGA